MINVFLCDDEQVLLDRYGQIVTDYIAKQQLNCQVFLKAKTGFDLLILLKESQTKGGIYFLDIDLANADLNGIELALKIRALDPYAQIAFISTHDELLMETLQQRVSVLNFIFKDAGLDKVTTAIQSTLKTAIELRDQQVPEAEVIEYFTYDNGLMFEKINIDEINFFETAHKIRHVFLHSDSSLIEFPGRIADIQEQLSHFYKAHKSILVNPDKVVQIDKEAHQITFANGDACDVSYRKIDELIKRIH